MYTIVLVNVKRFRALYRFYAIENELLLLLLLLLCHNVTSRVNYVFI